MTAPLARGRILPTLNEDGSRFWIRPRVSAGAWWTRRRITGYALIAFFITLPHLRWLGMPLILLDLPRREFTLLGNTFLPTDTLILMLLVGSAVLSIFLFSALFGRVWCGWGCPQTVYMEFVFRPIERLIEGGRSGSLALDKARGVMSWRRILKYAIYVPICLVLAHTLLAYFVGTDTLAEWVQLSPYEHPTPFLVMAVTTLLIFLDFGWFREQTCLIACPYGRWQSALIDKRSLIVAYDATRGEPRRAGSVRGPDAGDCVSCNACVMTCPTGIDIRNGLQMECVHCTQCIDACDHVMTALHKPTGLIRYASQEQLAGRPGTIWRPRVIIYSVALSITLGALALTLGTRAKAEIMVLRSSSEPWSVEADGRVANQLRVKIVNRSHEAHDYDVTVTGLQGGTVIAPELPLRIEPGAQRTTSLFLVDDVASFTNGRHAVTLRITDGDGFSEELPFVLLGPSHVAPQPVTP
ncbi:MAG TPA: cytochrome c oxidase accessory protein CcoG [Gemmatimonadaceae bacterium]|nr:cytochrome c oxidase accessory protein CcoG [Gemmatimonadaceae bacterium]